MAEILQRTAAEYIASYPTQAAPQVRGALAKLSLCRTAALGARHYRCEDCQSECLVYNSCGDRHCPTCRGARRADWVEANERLLALDEALDALAEKDASAAELVKLRYFAGFTVKEAAEILGVSARKADLLWAFARSWLRKRIDTP